MARTFWIKLKRAVNVLEVSAHVRHHHVPCTILGSGVPRLESPFSHLILVQAFPGNSELNYLSRPLDKYA
jgi:hypothetical protein